MGIWKPTVTPKEVIMHSAKGSKWEDHKYIEVVDGKYYYPNSYKDGRTISDLKESKLSDKDVDKIADETIAGKHGNGKDRKEKFGDDYDKVQNRVNEKLGKSSKKEDKEEEEKKIDSKDEKEEDKKDSDSKDKKEDEKDSKKKKGSGSSKKKDDKDKKKNSSKKGSGSSKKSGSKSSKSSDKNKMKKSQIDAITKARTEEQKKAAEERKRKNKINGKSYLNHADYLIWAPTQDSDELWHHGIEGQKWGKRNGPPYPLDSSQKSYAERKYRTNKGQHHKNQNGSKNRKASQMSNDDLKRQINRKELEQRYNDLSDAQISRGRQKVMSMVRDYATVAAAVLTTAKLVETGAKIIKHL